MTGIPLIIAFFIMVVVMIVAISKFKIHPFLSIMGVSLILALLALPLAKVPGTIGAGFSGTFSEHRHRDHLRRSGRLRCLRAPARRSKWPTAWSSCVGKKHPELGHRAHGLDRLHPRVL